MATSFIKPEDQEVLPSYVQSIQSSENHPVASWESVKKFITEDPIVKKPHAALSTASAGQQELRRRAEAEMPCHHHLCPNGRIWQKVD